MSLEEAKGEILKALQRMGCLKIFFQEQRPNSVVVTFDCKDLTSFKAEVPGWHYSGIELDETQERQYKIVFKRI